LVLRKVVCGELSRGRMPKRNPVISSPFT